MEFDRLVLSPPPSPSIGVGIVKVGRCTIYTHSGKLGEEEIHSDEAVSMPCTSFVGLARAVQFCNAFYSSYLHPHGLLFFWAFRENAKIWLLQEI